MTESESLNYLLGNFVSQGGESGAQGNIIQDKMVCIDTGNGFLGFNTIDPCYNIDVCNGTIRTNKLILERLIGADGDNIPEHIKLYEIYHDVSGYLKIHLPPPVT